MQVGGHPVRHFNEHLILFYGCLYSEVASKFPVHMCQVGTAVITDVINAYKTMAASVLAKFCLVKNET